MTIPRSQSIPTMMRTVLTILIPFIMGGIISVHGRTCAQYDTVQIQLKWLQQAQFAGYMVASELGFYREECLEVYIRPGGPNIVVEEEVKAQRAQFGIDWLSSMLVQREQKGLDMVLISQVFSRTSVLEITFADQNIRAPRDLIDKNVCVWYGGNELSLRALFDANHIRWDNDTSVNRAENSDANCIAQLFSEAEFLNGHCDAAAATRYNELALVLEEKNPATNQLWQEEDLFIFDFNHFNLSTYEDGIFVSREWLEVEGNRDIAVRFLRGSMKGWLYARDFPGDVNVQVFARNVHQDWMMNEISRLIFPTWSEGFGVAPNEKLQESADRAHLYGVLNQRANVSEFYRSDIALEAYLGATGKLAGVEPLQAPWSADLESGVYGSDDVLGMDWEPRKLRFCFNNDLLALCEGTRQPDKNDSLAADSGGGIAVLVLASLALAIICTIAALLIFLRAEQPVVAASLPFCLTICFGAALFVSAVFLSIGSTNTGKCHSRLWMMGLGFVSMMASFLIKVRRIDLIFNNTKMKTQKLPNDLLFKHLAVFIGIEIVLLALFSGTSDYAVETYDDPNNGKLTHTLCHVGNNTPGAIMTGFLFGYKAIILLWCIWLAYRTKDVVTSFNESSWLALSTYNLTFISIVIVPIVYFLGLSPQNQLIVTDIGVVVAVTLSCLLLFIPKLLSAYFGEDSQMAFGGTAGSGMHTAMGALSMKKGGASGKIGSPQQNGSKGGANGGTVLSQSDLFSKSPPIVPQNTPAQRGREYSLGQWENGLKNLTKDALLDHLKRFRQQEDQVRYELRAKGMTDAAIDEKLEDAGVSKSPLLKPLADIVRSTATTTQPSRVQSHLNSPINSRTQNNNNNLRPSVTQASIELVAAATSTPVPSDGTTPSYPTARDVCAPPVDEVGVSSSPLASVLPISPNVVTVSTGSSHRLRIHYRPESTNSTSTLVDAATSHTSQGD